MVRVIQYEESGVKKHEEQLLKRKRQSFIILAKDLNYQIAVSEPFG